MSAPKITFMTVYDALEKRELELIEKEKSKPTKTESKDANTKNPETPKRPPIHTRVLSRAHSKMSSAFNQLSKQISRLSLGTTTYSVANRIEEFLLSKTDTFVFGKMNPNLHALYGTSKEFHLKGAHKIVTMLPKLLMQLSGLAPTKAEISTYMVSRGGLPQYDESLRERFHVLDASSLHPKQFAGLAALAKELPNIEQMVLPPWGLDMESTKVITQFPSVKTLDCCVVLELRKVRTNTNGIYTLIDSPHPFAQLQKRAIENSEKNKHKNAHVTDTLLSKIEARKIVADSLLSRIIDYFCISEPKTFVFGQEWRTYCTPELFRLQQSSRFFQQLAKRRLAQAKRLIPSSRLLFDTLDLRYVPLSDFLKHPLAAKPTEFPNIQRVLMPPSPMDYAAGLVLQQLKCTVLDISLCDKSKGVAGLKEFHSQKRLATTYPIKELITCYDRQKEVFPGEPVESFDPTIFRKHGIAGELLQKAKLTPQTLMEIATSCPFLEKLDMHYTPALSLAAIQSLKNLKPLRHLCLNVSEESGNSLVNSGMSQRTRTNLSELFGALPELTHLEFYTSAEVDNTLIEEIVKRLPGLKLLNFPKMISKQNLAHLATLKKLETLIVKMRGDQSLVTYLDLFENLEQCKLIIDAVDQPQLKKLKVLAVDGWNNTEDPIFKGSFNQLNRTKDTLNVFVDGAQLPKEKPKASVKEVDELTDQFEQLGYGQRTERLEKKRSSNT